jgi:hypothetical protein
MSTESIEKPSRASHRAAPQQTGVSAQGSKVWVTWVKAAADHCRTDVSKLIDSALVEYVKSKGFNIPPPPR